MHDTLLAATEGESLRLLWMVASSQQGPDEDSRALARALLAVPAAYGGEGRASRLLGSFDAAFCAGLARFFVGDTAANGLGLPDTAWKYAFLALAPANLCSEAVGRAIPGAARAKSRVGRALNEFRTRRLLGPRPVEFAPRAAASDP